MGTVKRYIFETKKLKIFIRTRRSRPRIILDVQVLKGCPQLHFMYGAVLVMLGPFAGSGSFGLTCESLESTYFRQYVQEFKAGPESDCLSLLLRQHSLILGMFLNLPRSQLSHL